MTDQQSFTDKAGNQVVAGDFVVYGHALGRCAALRFGKVLSIKHGKRNDYSWSSDEWAIRVQGIDDDSVEIYGLRPCKQGTLMFPDRILNVNSLIPESYKKLLEEAK